VWIEQGAVVDRVEVDVEDHECSLCPVSEGTGTLAGVPAVRHTEVVELPVTVLNPTCGTVTVWEDQVRVVQGVPAG
jgi:hypothetical protein